MSCYVACRLETTGIIVDKMDQSKCPECSSTDLKPIGDPVLAAKGIDAPVIAYRCSKQHIFPAPVSPKSAD